MRALSTSDVLIIGGGVMGSATACFLARRGASVVVLESDATYETASSALSASSIRQQFSTPVCILMSRYSFRFMREATEHLGIDGERVELGLTERGYLYLADPGSRDRLQSAITVQQACGAAIAPMDQDDLRREFPWMQCDDLALGSLGTADEGWFDGYSLLQAFRRKARALGAVYVDARATGLVREGARVAGARTEAGIHSAGAVVNAAGFRAGEVARWAGVELPLGPERHCVFAFRCPGAPQGMPLIVDTTGVYVRPDGGHFICGGAATPHPGCEAPCFEVDHAQFEESVWPALAARVPAFEELKLIRGWAGQYDMNFLDHNAVIGWTPGVAGLAMVGGFSGHGIQHAPAAGRAVSELLLDGAYQTLDVSALDPLRIVNGQPLREHNLI